MSDKPRVQQALAQELADLLLSIKSVSSSAPGPSSAKAGNNGKSASLEHVEPAMRFLEGFYDAMIREWNGLDKWRCVEESERRSSDTLQFLTYVSAFFLATTYRMDKFYLLIRRFTNAALRLLARENWDRDATARFCGLLFKEGGPLCANDVKVPDGITYHMCDIYLDELNKAAAQSQGDDGAESRGATSQPLPILQLLQPFVDLAATCVSSLVYDRIVGSVLQPYLDDLLTTQIVEGALAEMSHEKAEKIGIDYLAVTQGAAKCSGGRSPMADQFSDELRRTIFAALFSAASASTSFEPRRRKLYRMCKDEEERREEEEEE